MAITPRTLAGGHGTVVEWVTYMLAYEQAYEEVKEHLAACLHDMGDDVRADQVARCCQGMVLVGGWPSRIPEGRCGYRLCPSCARIRRRLAFRRVFPVLCDLRRRHPRDRWIFITLTAPPSDAPLADVMRQLKTRYARLRRTKAWQRCIRAAVTSFEMVYRPGVGWQVHAHIVASRQRWWAQADLSAGWATRGAGSIVDVREIQDGRLGLRQVLYYILKPTNLLNWTAAQVAEFNALERTKLRECYGALRGLVGEVDIEGAY
jgi:hypothetical protein